MSNSGGQTAENTDKRGHINAAVSTYSLSTFVTPGVLCVEPNVSVAGKCPASRATDGVWMLAGGAAVPAEPAAAVRDALRPGPHQGQHHPVPRRGLRSHHPLEPQQVLSSTSHPPTHPPTHLPASRGRCSPTLLDIRGSVQLFWGSFPSAQEERCLWIVEMFQQKWREVLGFSSFCLVLPWDGWVVVNKPRNEAARLQRLDLLSAGPVEIIIPRVESALSSRTAVSRSYELVVLIRRCSSAARRLAAESQFVLQPNIQKFCSGKKSTKRTTTQLPTLNFFFGFPITERFISVLSGD